MPYLKKQTNELYDFFSRREKVLAGLPLQNIKLLKRLQQVVLCGSHNGFIFPSLVSSSLVITMPVWGSSSPNHIRFTDVSFCYSAYPLFIIYILAISRPTPTTHTKGTDLPSHERRLRIKIEPLGWQGMRHLAVAGHQGNYLDGETKGKGSYSNEPNLVNSLLVKAKRSTISLLSLLNTPEEWEER